jgi:hypothetical protein
MKKPDQHRAITKKGPSWPPFFCIINPDISPGNAMIVLVSSFRCGFAIESIAQAISINQHTYHFSPNTALTAIGIGEVVALYLLFAYRVRIDAAIGTRVVTGNVKMTHPSLYSTSCNDIGAPAPGVALSGYRGARFGALSRIAESHERVPEGRTHPGTIHH